MINSGKFQDKTNFLQFAGKTSNMQGDCVEKCIKPEKYYNVNFLFFYLRKFSLRKKFK